MRPVARLVGKQRLRHGVARVRDAEGIFLALEQFAVHGFHDVGERVHFTDERLVLRRGDLEQCLLELGCVAQNLRLLEYFHLLLLGFEEGDEVFPRVVVRSGAFVFFFRIREQRVQHGLACSVLSSRLLRLLL